MGRSWCTTMIVKEILCLCLLQTAVLSRNVYPVPNPYRWDESFTVEIPQIDDEHKILFKAAQDLSEDPGNVDLLNYARDVYRDHFDYEEKAFMACGEKCHAGAHKKKHDVFFKTLTWVTTPVSEEYLYFAKNWLAQ